MGIKELPLPDALRRFRLDARVSLRVTADVLGMSVRTLEGIEQGRPFRYAKLLRLAMTNTEAMMRMAHAVTTIPKAVDHEPAADTGTGGGGTGHRRRHAEGDAQGRGDPVHQHRPRSKARNAALRPR